MVTANTHIDHALQFVGRRMWQCQWKRLVSCWWCQVAVVDGVCYTMTADGPRHRQGHRWQQKSNHCFSTYGRESRSVHAWHRHDGQHDGEHHAGDCQCYAGEHADERLRNVVNHERSAENDAVAVRSSVPRQNHIRKNLLQDL